MTEKSNWGSLAEMLPLEIDRIKAATPIAYIPWGAIEWHSYHAPTGLDCHKAQGLCEALAAESGGIVLPPFYLGTETIKPFKGFPHTLEYSEAVIAMLCRETLEQLKDEGFKVLILITGHGSEKHQVVLRETAAAFQHENTDVGVWAFCESEVIGDTYPLDHAAKRETSFQLLFKPESVQLSRVPEGDAPTLDDDGVWGEDPRNATKELGERMLAYFLELATPQVQKMLKEYS